MMMTKKPPRKKYTNKKGRSTTLESAATALIHHKFRLFRGKRGIKAIELSELYQKRYVVMTWPHETVFGNMGKKEIYIHYECVNNGVFICKDGVTEIIVEAKFQESDGSVDEKFPLIWETFIATKVPNFIILYAGPYWDRGKGLRVINDFKERALGKETNYYVKIPDNKKMYVVNLTDFHYLMMKALQGDDK